ncbi:hypothetical protein CEXT_405781 [Caerostris extrusa]|uniref:Uncharacterized protein n=1 Tax=Caerostris extrusa TaxID=172846 RepID=A0AAV4UNN7_CAEEX|nr:hypothetical protein CEXT_405781 [Caerostris extrusa]
MALAYKVHAMNNLRRARLPLSSTQKTALPEGHHLEVGSEVPQGCPPSNQAKSFWTAPEVNVKPPLLWSAGQVRVIRINENECRALGEVDQRYNPRQPARRRSVSLNREPRLPVGRASALGHWWAHVCVGVWEWTNAATVLCHSQED